MRFVFFLLFIVLTLHLVKSESTSKKIVKSTSKKRLKTFEINLDEDPSLRWNEVATHFKTEAKLLLATLKPLIGGEIANKMVSAVNTSISQEYREEMEGIASVIDVAYEEVLLANVYYEVSGIGKNVSLFERACTSIVAQNTNGSVFLARNQDYPPPFELVEFHAVFKRNDEIVFQGTGFAGTIGLATGMGPSFSVSINARSYDKKGTEDGIDLALRSAANGAAVFPLFTRSALESNLGSFDDAIDYFNTHSMIMPGYLIVAGKNQGEGAIVTKNGSSTNANILRLFDPAVRDDGGGDWFVVQTNTDHWLQAPNYPGYKNTSRRGTAYHSLTSVGPDSIDFNHLWDVLSTKPVENAATIHRDFAFAANGIYETFKVHDPLL